MALAGYLETNFTSTYDNRLRFECEYTSYDRDNLTADISWRLYIISQNGFTNQPVNLDFKIEDVRQIQTTKTLSCAAGGSVLFASGTYSGISYDSVYSSAKIELYAYNSGAGISNYIKINTFSYDDCTLTSPFPYARILSAPTSMTDEAENIAISLSVPEPSKTTSLRLGIDFGSGYSYTTLSSNTTTFTYAITQSDRIAIQEHTDSKSFTIELILESTVDGYDYERTKNITCNFINAEPTFTAEIVDVNTTMTNLTGDATNKFVRGKSNAQITITSSPKKGAYIVSETVVCGAQTLDYGTGTLYGVESSDFVITVTDSRGYVTTQTIYKTLVNYIPLTCNLAVDIPSSSGSTVARISGNCFYGSFGIKTNTLTVRYRYAESSQAYSNWYSASVSIADNNTYAVNFSVSGLDYTKGYTFEAQAVDLIETTYSAEVKVKSTPVFDWGENDFNFNVPVNFAQGFTQPLNALKQLWNGQGRMESSSESITLVEPISQQANGIVLIFTPFNTTTNLANDEKLQAFFISKKTVQVMTSKMHTFFLMDGANFGTVGAKSLYISDTKVTGYANNTSSGTGTSGIKYDNTKFVLRYILGV